MVSALLDEILRVVCGKRSWRWCASERRLMPADRVRVYAGHDAAHLLPLFLRNSAGRQ
jgi:hypothetical protein